MKHLTLSKLVFILSSLSIIQHTCTANLNDAVASNSQDEATTGPDSCQMTVNSCSSLRHEFNRYPRNETEVIKLSDEPSALSSSSSPDDDLLHAHDAKSFQRDKSKLVPGPEFVDTQSWRFKYIDEFQPGYKMKVNEKSLDARMANALYTTHTTRLVNLDSFKFDSGLGQEYDQAVMESLAGPKVDNELCGHQLEQMWNMLNDFSDRLDRKRSNNSHDLELNEPFIRLTHVLESYGHYDSGTLLGKTFISGSHEQCTRVHLMLPATNSRDNNNNKNNNNNNNNNVNHDLVETRFCWARLKLDKHMDQSLRRRHRNPYEIQDSVLSVATCLPRSCHSKSFGNSQGIPIDKQHSFNRQLLQKLVDSQFRLPKSIYLDESLPLDSVFCTIDKEASYGLPLAGRLCLLFMAGWLILTGYSTWIINSVNAKEIRSSLSANMLACMNCLDLRQGWSDFLCEEEPKKMAANQSIDPTSIVELDTLNPVKVFGCLFVVLGHALIISAGVTMNSLSTYKSVEDDPLLLAGVVGTVIVDTFFVITGLFMCYVTLKKAEASSSSSSPNGLVKPTINGNHSSINSTKQEETETTTIHDTSQTKKTAKQNLISLFMRGWLKITVTRYARLVPLFFLVFWFKKTVYMYLLTQYPFWDNGFNKATEMGACKQESWLTPFSFMAAILPLSQQCLPQAWSVATDLFFSLFIPPILILFTRMPRQALLVSCLVSIASVAWCHQTILAIHPNMVNELLEMKGQGFALVFGALSYIYTYPHYRFCSILVGVVSGYLVYRYEKNKKQEQYHEQQQQQQQQHPQNNKTTTMDDYWPDWFRGPMTMGAIVAQISLFILLAYVPVIRDFVTPHHRQAIPHLFSSGRLIWAICNATVFIRMVTDWKDSFIMQMSRGRFWRIAVKLNFAILLIHMDFLMGSAGTQLTNGYFSKMAIYNYFAATIFFCIPMAIFLHLVYENPSQKLIKKFILPRL